MSAPEDDLKVAARALLVLTLEGLTTKIRSGEATAADFTAALKAAQQVGVEMIPAGNNAAAQLGKALTDKLPFAGDLPAH